MIILKNNSLAGLNGCDIKEKALGINNFTVGESEQRKLNRGVELISNGESSRINQIILLDKTWRLNIHLDGMKDEQNCCLELSGTPANYPSTDIGNGWKAVAPKDTSLEWMVMPVLQNISSISDFIWDTDRDDGGIFGHSGSTSYKMKDFYTSRFDNSENIMNAINAVTTSIALTIKSQ